MLRSNLDVSKELVNVAVRFIIEIIWQHFWRDQMYDTDLPSVRMDFGVAGSHIIEPNPFQFPAK